MELESIQHIDPAFVDDRGEIHNLFEGTLGHVAMITSKKGTVRANHYHHEDLQYIYLISGAYEAHSCPIGKDEETQILQVKPGDIVKTPPKVAHAQVFTEDSVFLAFTTRQREQGKYEDDTVAYPVVKGGYLNKNLKQESV